MLTLGKFKGINNQLPPERMAPEDLVVATNVDIGLTGEISRRSGYQLIHPDCHKNLFQARDFLLATVNHDLTAIHPGGERVVVAPSMGPARIWYCNLPDGRTAFSNGCIAGTTDGRSCVEWGMQTPHDPGTAVPIAGGLAKGRYVYALSYTREHDGLEGPLTFGMPFDLTMGGLVFLGLPEQPGYRVNIYLSGAGGDELFLVGVAQGDSYTYTGELRAQHRARTMELDSVPVGTLMAFWRGRILVAQGNTLWATHPHAWHLCDMTRDYKMFSAPITVLQPVDDGIYVGTEKELAFLAGVQFDTLIYSCSATGRATLGSGVAAPGDSIGLGDAQGAGAAMLCMVNGEIVAGMAGGQLAWMTKNRYCSVVREVAAVFRVVEGIPQYIAIPQ